jgi:hypothetical protein
MKNPKLTIGKPLIEPRLSQEQEMLGDLFGANPNNKVLFGSNDSESLPKIHGFLFSGEGGLTKNDRETASMFGI